jgi:HEPN domain-containing protein
METGSCVRFSRRARFSMKRPTAKWVRKAEDDLGCARAVEQTKPLFHDQICFLCQQSAEKYLKALFQEWGLVSPRTHNLEDLLRLLLPRDAALRTLHRRLKSLSRYAVDFRYPGKRAFRRQAQTALRHAEEVRREVRARLGLTP